MDSPELVGTPTETISGPSGVLLFAKAFCNALALILAWPAAVTCQLERALTDGAEGIFVFWAQAFALLPGLPGVYLRRGFYRQTLDHFEADVQVGFGAYFTHRRAHVEAGAYIGPYALIGSAKLRRNCLIGSRASLLSGGQLHSMDAHGNWGPADPRRIQQIEIGENAWLGEACVVMTDVGARAMVAAGAVVSAPVAERVVVAGNPARFVRKLPGPSNPEKDARATPPEKVADE